jgi:hypothetical protein
MYFDTDEDIVDSTLRYSPEQFGSSGDFDNSDG